MTSYGFDLPQGDFPMVYNHLELETASGNATQNPDQGIPALMALAIYGPRGNWIWPVINNALDWPIPVKFLGNTEGGALAMVLRNHVLFPDPMPQVAHADVGLAITVD